VPVVQACLASADCPAELRCVEGECIDPTAHVTERPSPRPFVGLVVLGGPAIAKDFGPGGVFDSDFRGSFLSALRFGVYIGPHELAVEVSPFTYVYYREIPGPTFQANATYGYLVPITGTRIQICWPLRVGAGFFAGNVGGDVYFQLRADLVGLAVRMNHFVLDVYAPSFRFAISQVNGVTPSLLSWEAGLGASYVF
jgi:hypothetical protein